MARGAASAPLLSHGAQELLDHIRQEDWVTYYETEMVLAPFLDVQGDGAILLGDFRNIVLWEGVSRAFAETVNELLDQRLVCRQPVSVMSYLLDGTCLMLPLAKSLRAYATPHWLPVCFRPIERCEAQDQRPREIRRRRKGQAGKAQRR